ncbi:MAG: hypothetical protein GY952_11665 [Rhodobacteraceae bacterium]|nr:hypothetical protein [Paracoccaceae bacterium]
MTILSTIQGVSKVIGLDVPSAVFSSTTREHVELAELANDMGAEIIDAYDWQALKGIDTHTGDASTEDFDLPADYKRMLKKAQVWSSSLETPLTPITDTDAWLGLDVQSFDFVINAWTIYADQMHIKPALASAVTAKYYYMSNLYALDTDGTTTQAAFDTDTDTFRLDERLLKLGMIFQWRKNKGLPYEGDEEKYETMKERLIAADKGSRLLRVGKIRFPKDVTVAYPQSIT